MGGDVSELRAARREAGVCLWCPKRAVKGKALCKMCRTKARERVDACREACVCFRCGSDYDGEMWACDVCRERDAARLREKRAGRSAR